MATLTRLSTKVVMTCKCWRFQGVGSATDHNHQGHITKDQAMNFNDLTEAMQEAQDQNPSKDVSKIPLYDSNGNQIVKVNVRTDDAGRSFIEVSSWTL